MRLDKKYCGPPRSGNGGYVCGLCAQHSYFSLSPENQEQIREPFSFEVKYKNPLPVETEFQVINSARESSLTDMDGNQVFAQGKTTTGTSTSLPDPITYRQAQEAAVKSLPSDQHIFPDCFVCGPNRHTGDGLRIFAGPLGSEPMVAAPWDVHPSFVLKERLLPLPVLWAALDCPGYFAYHFQSSSTFIPTVLAKMQCTVYDNQIRSNDLVVMGWVKKQKLPLIEVGTALFEGKHLLAQAEAVWMQPKNWSATNTGVRAN